MVLPRKLRRTMGELEKNGTERELSLHRAIGVLAGRYHGFENRNHNLHRVDSGYGP